MITEAIDFNFLLLENYKKLKIKENELATILMVDHLISSGNPFVTPDLLALKMNLDVKDIDVILANLIKRGFFEYKLKGKKTIASLDPLKSKLYKEFQISISTDAVETSSEKIKQELENIYQTYEKLLGRSLSPVEISHIHEWVRDGYKKEVIIDGLKEAISKGKKSIRSVDKILLSYSQREDVTHEGISSIDDNWDKNLEETIRIAKTPWIKKRDA